jgi:hypothetical protein
MKTWHRICTVAIIAAAILAVSPAFRSYSQTKATAPHNVLLLTPDPIGADFLLAYSYPLPDAPSVDEVAPKTNFLVSDPSGWVDIMPHKSFKGWTRVAIPPEKALDPVSQWKLDKAQGTILCEGNHGHEWLRYDHELANFLLHVEWRFEKGEGLKGYNSGVFVRNSLDGQVWHQAQVGARAYMFGKTLIHGEATPMTKSPTPPVDPLHAIGEWNTYEIRCDGPKITLWVNGNLTGEVAVPEVPKGYWGLEAEGFRIEFRNIKLKTLP